MRHLCVSLALLLTTATAAVAQTKQAPLPEETIPSVAKLPDTYPPDWVFIHDLHFDSILDGRVLIVDTQSPVTPLKGMVRAAQFGNLLHSQAKHELYTAETFYSRMTRGERTDAITIWDAATLQPKGEILLPGGKRQLSVIYPNLFRFTNGEKWALVANFTPAQSVTVVDLDGRKVLGDIDLPGCAQVYPTGERGFTSLCADGSLISISLDDKGKVASSKTVAGVQDIDRQPLFGTPAMLGRTAWFVSYYGELRGFDLSGPVAKPLPPASVGSAPGGTPQWRPGGWQVIASDARGLLYVLMSPNGREGSHKDGGSEVWVVDPVANKQVRRIELGGVATAIGITRSSAPRLIVARTDAKIDVFDPETGKLVHSLGASAGANPIVVTPVQP